MDYTANYNSTKYYQMEPIIQMYETPEDLAQAFALQLISWIKETDGDTFHVALSGGRTPSLLFSFLAAKSAGALPWQKIHFWWGDERMVVPTDPESNFGVANQLLFSKVPVSSAQIHRIRGESDPSLEVQRYAIEIKSNVPAINEVPAFDLILLGMGDDGHTASIFPNQMALLKSQEITGTAQHPVTGQQRITLTGKMINNAKKVAFLCTGVSKSKIFNEIIHNTPQAKAYPAAHIRPVGELFWFVDEACGKWN